MRICSFLLSLALFCQLDAAKIPVPWLFMVYIAADNNLSTPTDWPQFNLNQMMRVGSNSNIAIIAQVSRAGNVSCTIPPRTNRYRVLNGRLENFHQPSGAINAGNTQALIDFCAVCFNDYAPQHVVLDLWDHGSGYDDPQFSRNKCALRGICFDDYFGSYFRNAQLRSALQTICTRRGRPLDIIACDACMMQMLEFGALVQPYTRYVVASEQTIPYAGFDYANSLAPFRTRVPSVLELATQMVTSYRNFYATAHDPDVTLSVVDTAQLGTLVSQVNQIGSFLKTCLQKQSGRTVKNALTSARNASTRFYYTYFVDLQNALTQIKNRLSSFRLTSSQTMVNTLRTALTNALNQFSRAVPVNFCGSRLPNAKGLSIYWPTTGVGSAYLNSPFAASGNQWVAFLRAFS